jgi:hypothetical protein
MKICGSLVEGKFNNLSLVHSFHLMHHNFRVNEIHLQRAFLLISTSFPGNSEMMQTSPFTLSFHKNFFLNRTERIEFAAIRRSENFAVAFFDEEKIEFSLQLRKGERKRFCGKKKLR